MLQPADIQQVLRQTTITTQQDAEGLERGEIKADQPDLIETVNEPIIIAKVECDKSLDQTVAEQSANTL